MKPTNHSAVYVESTESDVRELTRRLLVDLGGPTVQAMAGSHDNTAPHRWAHPQGTGPGPAEEQRVRLGYRVWKTLEALGDREAAAAWLLEGNPELGGATPVEFIAQLHTREVVALAESLVLP
ncbi:antitoxin Xre/MbcA/ParS toxin-binding domain-containing protein [Paeniglutamicibacter sp. R2-26]|uniref:antitoxin Xre/MbcA/ParS toxin-binding domain-containing protein n=1 Tax=Paeniglutamicibacter sp. R2-26 TaxID=3144417 RepID=UPI003EE5559D